jgi:hypothetical protein
MRLLLTRKHFFLFFILFFNIVIVLGYFFYAQKLVQQAFQNTAPEWFNSFIRAFYPRFFTEKYRFELSFFLAKTNQIVLRIFFCELGILILFFYKKQLFSFFDYKINIKKVQFFKIWLMLILLFNTFEWYESLVRMSYASDFFEPHFLFSIFPFPSEIVIKVLLFSLWTIGILLLFQKKYRWISTIFLVFLFLLLQSYLYGFQKIDHTYATFGYILMLLPFLEYYKDKGWIIRLMQIAVAITYLQAVLEKLLVSQFHWFEADNFRTFLLLHPTKIGHFISQYDFLCVLFPFFALCFELGFIFIFFFEKYKIYFTIMGILFHLATYVLLGVGGWFSVWWLVYFVFFLGSKRS